MDALSEEITRISTDTTFGGRALLDGSAGAKFDFQVGAYANQTIAFTLTNYSFGIDGLATEQNVTTVFASGAGNIDVSVQSHAQAVLGAVDVMIQAVDSKRSELGAVQNRLDSTIRNQENVSENVNAARSRIRDADFATETANMTKQNILQQAASSVLAQANQRPQAALSLLQG